MESNKNSQSDGGNDAVVYGVAGIALLGVVFWLFARIPAFLFGAGAALMATGAFNRRTRVIDKLKAAFGTLSFFYFILYVTFGFSGIFKSDFTGNLIKFEWYKNAVIEIAIWWNGFIPSFLKGMHLTDAMLTSVQISKFMVTSAIAGTIAGFVLPVLYGLFASKKKEAAYYGKENEFLVEIFELPYFIFRMAVEEPIKRCVALGHVYGVNIRRFDWRSLIRFSIALLIGALITLILSRFPSYFKVQSEEATYLIGTILASVPLGSFVLGFALGLIPYLGDSVLFHLFDSKLEGVKVIGASPKLSSGFLLGRRENNSSFYLTENNLAYHVEIVAPTGSGKTNILKNLIADRIEKGHGIIFLDYKADFDVLNWMYRLAKVRNRTDDLRLISLANPDLSVPYNPMEGGTASELTSRLMNSFEWSSEQYYLNAAKSALSRVMRGLVEYRDLTKIPFHVGHVYRALTDSNYLRTIAAELKSNKKMYSLDLIEVAEKIDRPSDAKEIRGLISNLESLMFSSIGSLLTEDTESGSYSLKEAIDESRITYCLMNSLLLKESSKALGKLFLQDLMSFVGRRFAMIERGEDAHKPITLIIDEFAAFAIPEFVDFLDRARSAGIGVIIAHQDRADLKNISPEFQARVEANTNTTIVSGVKDPKDAEHFAGMLGTKTTVKETWQESSGFLGDTPTGVKSKREVDEYVIHPNRIKKLQQGEILSISRTIDPHFGMVFVPRAQEFVDVGVAKGELITYFKNSRALYRNENKELESTQAGANEPGLRFEKNIKIEEQSSSELWS